MDRPHISLVISTFGVVTFALFGSQADVLECWHLKRPKDQAMPPSSMAHPDDMLHSRDTTGNDLVDLNNGPHSRTIRIPLTFRALRSFAGSSSSHSGNDSKKGESTTSYGMGVLHTLNKNPAAPERLGLPYAHNAGSVSTQVMPLNPAALGHPSPTSKEGSSTSLPSTNFDGSSIGITFNPPSIAEAHGEAVSHPSNVV